MFKSWHPLRAVAILMTAATPTTAPSPPTPTDSFDVGTLHVDKFGAGPQTLILIPGLACGSWVWAKTITQFAPHYTLYVVTLPGFDGRPASTEKALFPAFTRDFWTLLDTRHIKTPVVLGHSIGGTLAIALAEEHPERLSAIIAVDGMPIFPMLASATPDQREATASQMAATYASLSKTDELAAEKDYMTTIGTNKPEWIEPAARLEARSDPKAVAAWLREDLTTDLRPTLAKITIPFLEIMPYQPEPTQSFTYTQNQTLAFYKSLLAGAPKATVIPIAPSRHFVMLDQPDAFNKTIASFLTSLQ
jgi:pimeloyl-ACP methyl ester carboxylesterase